jgi:hypothetical protein
LADMRPWADNSFFPSLLGPRCRAGLAGRQERRSQPRRPDLLQQRQGQVRRDQYVALLRPRLTAFLSQHLT